MRLIDYMRERALDDAGFAKLFNTGLPPALRCTEHAVKKWKYGERIPGADRIAIIERATKGAVSLQDWISETAASA